MRNQTSNLGHQHLVDRVDRLKKKYASRTLNQHLARCRWIVVRLRAKHRKNFHRNPFQKSHNRYLKQYHEQLSSHLRSRLL